MRDLMALARRINQREKSIELLKDATLDKAREAMSEVLLQGQDLLLAKQGMPHGQWLGWLTRHCPRTPERSAQVYMRLASHPQRIAELLDAGSIRRALSLLDDNGAARDQTAPKQWPPYLEAIGRMAKLTGYLDRNPIASWPEEGVNRFREGLLPVARRLWPDKFGPAPGRESS